MRQLASFGAVGQERLLVVQDKGLSQHVLEVGE